MAEQTVGTGRTRGAAEEPPLGWLLSAVGAAVATGFRQALPDGVHPRQFAVLDRLASVYEEGGYFSQRELAGQLGIPQGRLVSLLDDLQGRGWITRGPAPGDKRAYRVRLTAAGATVAGELRQVARRYDQSVVVGLSPQEQAELRRLLGAVAGGGERPSVW